MASSNGQDSPFSVTTGDGDAPRCIGFKLGVETMGRGRQVRHGHGGRRLWSGRGRSDDQADRWESWNSSRPFRNVSQERRGSRVNIRGSYCPHAWYYHVAMSSIHDMCSRDRLCQVSRHTCTSGYVERYRLGALACVPSLDQSESERRMPNGQHDPDAKPNNAHHLPLRLRR